MGTIEQVTAANVDRGCALITEFYEGDKSWMSNLDLTELDISSPYKCVLGQRFGDYTNGLRALGITHFGRAVDNGFLTYTQTGLTNELLTEAWRAKITAERAAA